MKGRIILGSLKGTKLRSEHSIHRYYLFFFLLLTLAYRKTYLSKQPLTVPFTFTVYLCGWKYHEFAEAVFPEARVREWGPGILSFSALDVLIASTPCDPLSTRGFPGSILYVDGEPGQMNKFEHPRVYYLGVKHPPNTVNASLQLFHVAHSTLFHPYSATDFLHVHPPKLAPNFLMYVNSNCVQFREDAFDAIVQLAALHNFPKPAAAGKCHGKHPEFSIFSNDRSERLANIVDKFSSYRFALVMENSKVDGYITEKIANAIIAGCIPIYYGTPEVFNIFNKDRFIFYDIQHPESALEQVSLLESNHTAILEMLNLPILAQGEVTLRRFFSLSDDIGGGLLKYRIRRMIGLQS